MITAEIFEGMEHIVEVRKGESYKRCRYCSCQSFCDQYAEGR